jgi:uncharacterized membrane protein HdeD (DUF308 family)
LASYQHPQPYRLNCPGASFLSRNIHIHRSFEVELKPNTGDAETAGPYCGAMLSSLTRNWWLVALRGTLAVIFGVIAFAWPGITFEALVLLFGIYAFADGVLVFSFGLLAAGDGLQWWPLVLGGILGIGLGVLTFARPEAMGTALVYVVGFWAIVTGLLEIVGAIRLRDVISGEWMMGLSGALSIVFGVLVVAQPNSGAIALVYLFGLYAILAGASQIALGFRLHGLNQDVQKAPIQTVSSASR